MFQMWKRAGAHLLVVVGVAVVIAGCGGGGGSGDGSDDGGGGVQAYPSGTYTIPDGSVWLTACRPSGSVSSDMEKLVFSGTTMQNTLYKWNTSSNSCGSGIGSQEQTDIDTGTITVDGTVTADWYADANFPSTIPPASLPSNLTASKITFTVTSGPNVGGVLKAAIFVDTRTATPVMYTSDDRGTGTPCNPAYCTSLSPFGRTKQ